MVIMPSHGERPGLVIADNHAMFAEALKFYLEKTYMVVGVVTHGRQWSFTSKSTGRLQG